MSTLVVDEYKGIPLAQPFKLESGIISVASIKAMFYVHNKPAGLFKMELKRGAEVIASWEFTAQDLKDSFGSTKDYFHVIYPFYKPNGIRLDRGDYVLEFSSVGYTYAGSAWIGWCKDWQGYQGEVYDPQPTSFINYPYSYRLLEYGELK